MLILDNDRKLTNRTTNVVYKEVMQDLFNFYKISFFYNFIKMLKTLFFRWLLRDDTLYRDPFEDLFNGDLVSL